MLKEEVLGEKKDLKLGVLKENFSVVSDFPKWLTSNFPKWLTFRKLSYEFLVYMCESDQSLTSVR